MSKKRTRRAVKFQRAITGASLAEILAKRNQKPEVRKAQREQAIRSAPRLTLIQAVHLSITFSLLMEVKMCVLWPCLNLNLFDCRFVQFIVVLANMHCTIEKSQLILITIFK